MAKQLEQNLWIIDVPLEGNPLKSLNSYLIMGEERSLLIDTGSRNPACQKSMESQLKEIGVDRTRMDIFLTHLHNDHIGLAPVLIQKDCKIYISEIDWWGVERTFNNDFLESFYTPLLQEGFSQQEIVLLDATTEPMILNRKIWEEQCVRLQDGDVLRCGSHTLECILTPGHTLGHMCLYEPEWKWFFSGDHVLFTITPNISRWDEFPILSVSTWTA